MLSSLFVSYVNRAAALESTTAAPSPDSEDWKNLRAKITPVREENEKLKSENREVVRKLEAAIASQEALRSQVLSLMEVNTTQHDDIKSLRAELIEAKDKYHRFMVDSNAASAGLQVRILDLEVGTRT